MEAKNLKIKFEINIEIDNEDFTLYALDEYNSTTDKVVSTSEETKSNIKAQIKNALEYKLDYLFNDGQVYDLIDNDPDLPVFDKDRVKFRVELK